MEKDRIEKSKKNGTGKTNNKVNNEKINKKMNQKSANDKKSTNHINNRKITGNKGLRGLASKEEKRSQLKRKKKIERKEEREKRRESTERQQYKKSEIKMDQGSCPYFKKCGNCRYLEVSYEKQLHIKQRYVEKLIGGFCKVYPIKGMKQPFYYRNKVHAVFGYDRKEHIISGAYKEKTHHIISIDSCLLENQQADRIIITIRNMLKGFKIKTYDEDTGYGFLRHVLIRCGIATGQFMVVFVTASPVFPSKNNFVKVLLKAHPEITTIVQNINEKQTSMVLGERNIIMYGRGYIEDKLCGITYRISPHSFYQVNPIQTEYLYKKAIELAALSGKETVIDAYCGIGTIGMTAAEKAASVIGIELNEMAVKDAVLNARNNHIENIQFYCNDAGKFLEQYASEGKADVLFMDPPRSGSSEKFMDSIGILKPKKIIYISCNPDTLARDMAYLKKKGYMPEGCWPYDMFCWTEHVECVVLMSRIEKL